MDKSVLRFLLVVKCRKGLFNDGPLKIQKGCFAGIRLLRRVSDPSGKEYGN
jgi:hypothetical protein